MYQLMLPFKNLTHKNVKGVCLRDLKCDPTGSETISSDGQTFYCQNHFCSELYQLYFSTA